MPDRSATGSDCKVRHDLGTRSLEQATLSGLDWPRWLGLGEMLLTPMYLLFGLLIHLPRVIADPHSPGAWGEHGVNLVLADAAWLLADTLAGARRNRFLAPGTPEPL